MDDETTEESLTADAGDHDHTDGRGVGGEPAAPDESGDDTPSGPATVVGIGTSAGGLAALRELFATVPDDTGIAWVIVVHLSPDHESHLAELLQPHVPIPIEQVTTTIPLEPDRAYVIPPNANLDSVDTHLRLSELEERRRERAPIDHFFRTLARTHDGDAIGVVLTGTGSDGALGLREIKEQGGLTVVQDPAEAEYGGMPQSAVATGLVDLVLPLREIPGRIVDFTRTEPAIPGRAIDDEPPELPDEQHLHRVYAQIRARTGHDFARYKKSTILRRIARRMAIRGSEQLTAYIDLLREEPEEVRTLAEDLLITVTSFFRDPEVFDALEREVVPSLLADKGPGDTVRVWSVGCATGEEAYSLAILLLEAVAELDAPPQIQIFASDLHERSLAAAREGFYPGNIASDVSKDRLERYFEREDGGYRIRGQVRELVVFSPHNLLGDPPFGHLDLVACRNLLIYLERQIQRDVLELFHYSLRSDGVILLGTSETVDAADLFTTVDHEHRIYRRRNVPAPEPRLPVFPLTPRTMVPPTLDAPDTEPAPIAYGALHQRTLEHHAPPSLLVSPDDRVVHLSERVGRYLVHPGGEPTAKVVKLVREELRLELRAALHEVREHGRRAQTRPQQVQLNGDSALVVMDVRGAVEPGLEDHVLVLFLELGGDRGQVLPATPEPAEHDARSDADHDRAHALESELELTKSRLHTLVEEYETSQEELRASNEELQSSNEELRSTLEELETSKEELQSINEELQTVNQENRHKVEELSQLSDDLQNLLTATDIATLFLDRDLRILRFTPRVTDLFSIRLADRGRPLSDITHRLDYDQLMEDARTVLDRLAPVEREIGDDSDNWFLTRVRPYRSHDDRIEGVVLTFVDITARRRAEEALLANEERQAFLLRLSDEIASLVDPAALEATACRLLGEHLEVDRTYFVEILPDDGVAVVTDDHARDGVASLAGEHPLAAFEWVFPLYGRGDPVVIQDVWSTDLIPDGDRETAAQPHVAWIAIPLLRDGELIGAFCVGDTAPRGWTDQEVELTHQTAERLRDAVERARFERALRTSEARLRLALEAAEMGSFVWLPDEDRGEPDERMLALFGLSPEGRLNLTTALEELLHPEDRQGYAEAVQRSLDPTGSGRLREEVRAVHPSGELRWLDITGQVSFDGDPPRAVMMSGVAVDITERKDAEQELLALTHRLEERVTERTLQVRELSQTLTETEQQERQRLSRLLHDDLQQLLYGIQMHVTIAQERAQAGDESQAVADATAQALSRLDEAIARTRQLTIDLNPPILRDEGLVHAIGWLRTYMRDLHGLSVEVHGDGNVDVVPVPRRILVFHVVRELLFNVAKHADTETATVVIERDGSDVRITVTDDGDGFHAAEALDEHDRPGVGIGLVSARERLRMQGGDLELRSSPGSGTRVVVRVPATPTDQPPGTAPGQPSSGTSRSDPLT